MQIRRSARATVFVAVNLVLNLAAGVVLVGNEWVSYAPSMLWMAIGAAFVLRGLLILSSFFRPVIVDADARGLWIRRVFGAHRFAWEDLIWVDFDTSARVVIVAAHVAGRDRYAAVLKRGIEPETLDALLDEIKTRRPDLPLRNPANTTPEETPHVV